MLNEEEFLWALSKEEFSKLGAPFIPLNNIVRQTYSTCLAELINQDLNREKIRTHLPETFNVKFFLADLKDLFKIWTLKLRKILELSVYYVLPPTGTSFCTSYTALAKNIFAAKNSALSLAIWQRARTLYNVGKKTKPSHANPKKHFSCSQILKNCEQTLHGHRNKFTFQRNILFLLLNKYTA